MFSLKWGDTGFDGSLASCWIPSVKLGEDGFVGGLMTEELIVPSSVSTVVEIRGS